MARFRRPWSRAARVEAAVAVGVAVALVVACARSAAESDTPGVVVLGAAAVVLLVAAVATIAPAGVWFAVALLGAACAVARVPAVPVFAVGLFLVAEAAIASGEDRLRSTADAGVRRDRALLLAGVCSGSLVLGAGLELLAGRDAGGRGGPAYTVVAAACIVALAGLMVAGARVRTAGGSRPPRA